MRSKKDILKRSRSLRKKRLIKKLIFCSLVFLLVLAGLVGFFYIPYLRVANISISGNSSVATADLLSVISGYLNAKELKIIPADNILVLPKNKIIAGLLEKFPRLQNVSLNKNFPNNLSVSVKEKTEEAVFCQEINKCFFLDGNGAIFEPAPNFSPGVYLIFSSEATSTWELNSQVFRNLIDFKNLVAGDNIKISQIILKDENIYQLTTDEGWYLLLNDRNEPEVAFQNLKITLNQIGDQRKNLSYLDLRFGNKVYYKFK